MPRQVSYTAPTGVYRPYLEVVFCNSVTGKCGPKTFGLIDSGADGNVIPFQEIVSWIYPDPATDIKLKELEAQFERLSRAASEPTLSPEANPSILAEITKVEVEIQQKNKNLEPDILLGRPFFDNFRYLKFLHHDRRREHECSFEYEINEEKVLKIEGLK